MHTRSTGKVLQSLRCFLKDVSVMSLATVDDEGLAYAANIYVASDEAFRFYFLSNPQSAHVQHILHRPEVALTAYAPIRTWQQVRGVQIRGRCLPVPADRFAHVWGIYVGKYPHINEVRHQIQTLHFYRVVPDRLRWIDNSRHFGFRVDLQWPLPAEIPTRSDYATLV